MLTFCNVSLHLNNKTILDQISFSLRPHHFTALVGRNGSGKSSLFSCVNQQIAYTGQIFDGEKKLALMPARERAKRIAILPQSIPAPHILAREMAAFGRNPYLDFTGRLTKEDLQAVHQALTDADALTLSEQYVDTLSGGERQRVALAMILAQNTPTVLLDEPTAHMDKSHEEAFLRQLTNLNRTQKKTFLVVLHDLSTAIEYADDLIVLDSGNLVFSGTKTDCLREEILERTFALRRYTFDDGKIFFSAK